MLFYSITYLVSAFIKIQEVACAAGLRPRNPHKIIYFSFSLQFHWLILCGKRPSHIPQDQYSIIYCWYIRNYLQMFSGFICQSCSNLTSFCFLVNLDLNSFYNLGLQKTENMNILKLRNNIDDTERLSCAMFAVPVKIFEQSYNTSNIKFCG